MHAKSTDKTKSLPEYGTLAKDPYKTWELVIPFPDTKTRITVTVFSMCSCPNAEKFRGVASKIKLGSEGIEL